MNAYSGVTYYGTQAVKPAPFQWHVPAYVFLSGVAGGAQVIAALADLRGAPSRRTIVRNGRALGMAGALTGPLLLVRDLKTPRRWYNMLRIFRRTSAMSIGSYVLISFGAMSALATLAQALRGARRRGAASLAIDAGAAAAGAGMLSYTGALLSSTSTPLWAAQSPLLSARFAAGGFASGAAALSLGEAFAGRTRNAAALDHVAASATVTYAAITHSARSRAIEARVAEPIEHGEWGALDKIGETLAVAVPLACYALNLVGRRSRALSIIGAASALAGAALTRYAEFEAGKASAKRPADYLRYTSAGAPEDR